MKRLLRLANSSTNYQEHPSFHVAPSGKIAVGNESAINALVNLIATAQDKDAYLLASILKIILPTNQMANVVTPLSGNFKSDYAHYYTHCSVIRNCAQSMPYSALYESRHRRYYMMWLPEKTAAVIPETLSAAIKIKMI